MNPSPCLVKVSRVKRRLRPRVRLMQQRTTYTTRNRTIKNPKATALATAKLKLELGPNLKLEFVKLETWTAKLNLGPWLTMGEVLARYSFAKPQSQFEKWKIKNQTTLKNCDQTLQSIVINHISIGIENDLYIHERISGVKMNPSPCLVKVSRVKRRLRPRVRLMQQRTTYTTRNRTIKNPKATALATAKLKLELGPNLKLEFVKHETWTAKLNLSPWLTIGEVLARYSFAMPNPSLNLKSER